MKTKSATYDREENGVGDKVRSQPWKDRALVELNVAILHSFAQSGVTMVDYHTAARQFITHIEREEREGRDFFDFGFPGFGYPGYPYYYPYPY